MARTPDKSARYGSHSKCTTFVSSTTPHLILCVGEGVLYCFLLFYTSRCLYYVFCRRSTTCSHCRMSSAKIEIEKGNSSFTVYLYVLLVDIWMKEKTSAYLLCIIVSLHLCSQLLAKTFQLSVESQVVLIVFRYQTYYKMHISA